MSFSLTIRPSQFDYSEITTAPNWEQLIKTKDWTSLANSLIEEHALGIVKENEADFQSTLWRLIDAWSEQWKRNSPPENQRQAIHTLLLRCTAHLQKGFTDERISKLIALLQHGFKSPALIQLIQETNILEEEHLKELLKRRIQECFNCDELHQFHHILPEFTINIVSDNISSHPLKPQEQLLALTKFLKQIDSDELNTLQPQVIDKLISERRFNELKHYIFSNDFSKFFERLFFRYKDDRNFLVAEEMLNQWKCYSEVPLETQELEFLTLQIENNYRLQESIKKTITLWNTIESPPIKERSFALCNNLLSKSMRKMETATVTLLWNFFVRTGIQNFTNTLDKSRWNIVLKNLHNNQAFDVLWEALWHRLTGAHELDDVSKGLLQKLLGTTLTNNRKRTSTGCKNHLHNIISTLDRLVQWEQELDLEKGLTVLVIRNLAALMLSQKNSIARQENSEKAGLEILHKIRSTQLSPENALTTIWLENRLLNKDTSPLPSITLAVIPVKKGWSKKELVFFHLMGMISSFVIFIIFNAIMRRSQKSPVNTSFTITGGDATDDIEAQVFSTILETANTFIAQNPGVGFDVELFSREQNQPLLKVKFDPEIPTDDN